MENRVRFFAACPDCGWEEVDTHETLAESTIPSCPKCHSSQVTQEIEMQKPNDYGDWIRAWRTFKRYGSVVDLERKKFGGGS